jgi:hypothetical protein
VDIPWLDYAKDCGAFDDDFLSRADESCSILLSTLGEEWLRSARLGRARKHRLLSQWQTRGEPAPVILSRIADEFRLLRNVRGFEHILVDIKNAERCQPALHTLSTAALFERGAAGSVLEFCEPSDRTIPDFILQHNDQEIPVEAKLLSESDRAKKFYDYCDPLLHDALELRDNSFPSPGWGLFLIFSDVDLLPSRHDVIASLRQMSATNQTAFRAANGRCLATIEPLQVRGADPSATRLCMALCPRSTKDNVRVVTRASGATEQLKARQYGRYPGIVSLGTTDNIDPLHVHMLLNRKFSGAQLQSISAALLLKSGTTRRNGKLINLDQLDWIINSKARYPLVDLPSIESHGAADRLLQPRDPPGYISTYQSARAVGRLKTGDGTQGLVVPDVQRIPEQVLRWLSSKGK